MKRMLILALVVILCGCNMFTKRVKDVPDPSEVAEVPDEVWKRVQKKLEDRAKTAAPKKEEQPSLDRERERSQLPDPTGKSGTADKRK